MTSGENTNPPHQPTPGELSQNTGIPREDIVSGEEAAIEERMRPYPDAETFFARSATLYGIVDTRWRMANAARKDCEETLSTQVVAVQVQDEAGKDRVELREAEGLAGRKARRQEGKPGPSPRMVIGASNRDAYDYAAEFAKTSDFRNIAPYVEGQELQLLLERNSFERLISREKRLRPVLGTETDEIRQERLAKLAALDTAYEQAFLAQLFGIAKLRRAFDDDRLVLPLLGRLEEIATMSAQGSVEFPGLLETVQAHIAGCQNEGKPNMLSKALERVRHLVVTPHEFTEAIVLGDQDPKKMSPNASDEFVAGVKALRSAVNILNQSDVPATSEQIALLISEHLDSMPRDWQKAYEDATNQRIATIWNRLSLLLQKFDQPGRLPSDVTSKDLERAYGGRPSQLAAGPKKRGRRGNPAASRPTNASVAAVADIVGEEQPKAPASFAVLKSTGSTKEIYRLEESGTIDDLMKTRMVTKFLDAYTGLTEPLRAFLERIAADPYHEPGVGVVHDRSFQLAGRKGSRYTLRRYKPSQIGHEADDSTSQLIGRLRILYGIGAISGSTCVMIQDIDIRDQNTYR